MVLAICVQSSWQFTEFLRQNLYSLLSMIQWNERGRPLHARGLQQVQKQLTSLARFRDTSHLQGGTVLLCSYICNIVGFKCGSWILLINHVLSFIYFLSVCMGKVSGEWNGYVVNVTVFLCRSRFSLLYPGILKSAHSQTSLLLFSMFYEVPECREVYVCLFKL